MIYNVVLVSGVRQSESVIHIHLSTVFFLDSFGGHLLVLATSSSVSVVQKGNG